MARETEIIQEEVPHQLEEVFDIEPGTTLVETQKSSTELVPVEEYDDKDSEIEGQFQEVYDAAMDAYEGATGSDMQDIEPKYRARNMEVSVQYLNTALNAAKMKADLKTHKDKLGLASKKASAGSKVVNNNLVVDRNELLKSIIGRGDDDGGTVIDGETT